MPSLLHMYGSPMFISVAELPAVVQERIDEAKLEGSDWVVLTSFGRVVEYSEPLQYGPVVYKTGEQKDSFKEVRVRHEIVLAIREAHPGEIPGVEA